MVDGTDTTQSARHARARRRARHPGRLLPVPHGPRPLAVDPRGDVVVELPHADRPDVEPAARHVRLPRRHRAGGAAWPTSGSVLATHPYFAPGWVQKLCYYANSSACDASDPAFLQIVSDFTSSNYDWNSLVKELLSSPIVTNAVETATAAQNGEVVAVSRRDHLCAALNARLGFSDVCGLTALYAKGRRRRRPSRRSSSGLPSDGYGRGAVAPVLPNQPTLFFRAGHREHLRGGRRAGHRRARGEADSGRHAMVELPAGRRHRRLRQSRHGAHHARPADHAGHRAPPAALPVGAAAARRRRRRQRSSPPSSPPAWRRPSSPSGCNEGRMVDEGLSTRRASVHAVRRRLRRPARARDGLAGVVSAESAQGSRPDAPSGPSCAQSKAQYIIFSTSGNGDPINASVPGTYDDPAIVHSPDPSDGARAAVDRRQADYHGGDALGDASRERPRAHRSSGTS